MGFASSEIILTRMQCGGCKTMLACDLDHRREPMVCPLCGRLAPLVRVPPPDSGEAQTATPLHELPVAKRPGKTRRLWPRLFWYFLFFGLGFLVYAVVFALDHARPIDRLTRRLVNVVREEMGLDPVPLPGLPPPEPPRVPERAKAEKTRDDNPNTVRLPPMPEQLRRAPPVPSAPPFPPAAPVSPPPKRRNPSPADYEPF